MLFEILACEKDKNKMMQVLEEQSAYNRLDEESAKAIIGMLGVKVNLNTIRKTDENQREVYDMCKAFEDYKKEGKKEGEIIALRAVIKNLMKNQKVTFEEAVKMAGISKSKQKELQTLI